jgi:hypothetical protein
MAVVSYEYATLAIEVCLFLIFAAVSSSTYFRFCQVRTNLLGDINVIRLCARAEHLHLSYNAPLDLIFSYV